MLGDGWVDKPYRGTSAAFIFKNKVTGDEVTINYGGGLHTERQVYSNPVYYKITGPKIGTIKVIDPTIYRPGVNEGGLIIHGR